MRERKAPLLQLRKQLRSLEGPILLRTSYIIEVRSQAAGIVVRDLGGYRFSRPLTITIGWKGSCFATRGKPSVPRSGSPAALDAVGLKISAPLLDYARFHWAYEKA
jgi:hypothetical protein